MALINCEITLDLTWLANCIIFEEDRAITFAIADAKFYVPVVTLINEDKWNLLQQWNSGFKRSIKWNKCQLKVPT